MTDSSAEIEYKSTMIEIIEQGEKIYLLPAFWYNRTKWPRGDKNMMFMGEALSRIGNAAYPNIWNYEDLSAATRIERFPDFKGTLVHHVRRLRKKATELGDTVALSALPKEPDFRAPIPPLEMKQRAKAYTIKLEEIYSHLKPLFEWGTLQWEDYNSRNNASRERLTSSIDQIHRAAIERDIITYLRFTDVKHRVGDYVPAPNGFWNTSNVISERLCDGHVSLLRNNEKDEELDFDDYYIYFESSGIDHLSSKIDGGQLESEEEETDFLYLDFMRKMSRELGRDTFDEGKKDELIKKLIDEAPGYLRMSVNLASNMATLLRPVKRSSGGAQKQKKRDT